MITEERFFELIDAIKKELSEYFVEKLNKDLENFDFNIFETTYNIIKQKDLYSKDEWLKLFDKYKDNEAVVCVLLDNCKEELPETLYNDILQSIVKSSTNNKYTDMQKTIVLKCLQRELSDDALSMALEVVSLRNVISRFFENTRNRYKNPNEEEKSTFVHQENVKKLSHLAIEEYKELLDDELQKIAETEEQRKLMGEPPLSLAEKTIPDNTMANFFSLLNSVSYIKDVDYLYSLLDEFFNTSVSELLANSIINNVFIDENDPNVQRLLNEALSQCDICMLTYIPNCIAKEVSLTAYSALTHFINDDFYLTGWGLKEVPGTQMGVYPGKLKNIIENLCTTEKIDESVEIDLAYRIIKARKRADDSFITSVFSHISDPNLFLLFEDLCNNNKTRAYNNNPYLPPDMLIERAEEYSSKINKLVQKGQERKVSDVWYEHIIAMAKKTTLSDKCYDTLLNSNRCAYILDIISLPTTPHHILDKAIEQMNQNDKGASYWSVNRIISTAKINKLRIDNKINETAYETLCRTIDSSVFLLEENEDLKQFANRSSITFALQGIDTLAYYHNKEAIQAIECIKDCLKNNYFNEAEVIFYNRVIDRINEKMKDKEIEDKIREMPQSKYKKLLNNIKYKIHDHQIYTYFPNVIDDLDKYHEASKLEEPPLNINNQETEHSL